MGTESSAKTVISDKESEFSQPTQLITVHEDEETRDVKFIFPNTVRMDTIASNSMKHFEFTIDEKLLLGSKQVLQNPYAAGRAFLLDPIKNKTGSQQIFPSCHLKMNPIGEIEIKKYFCLVIETNTDLDKNETIKNLVENFQALNVTLFSYSYFESQGFPLCDELKLYLNNCRALKQTSGKTKFKYPKAQSKDDKMVYIIAALAILFAIIGVIFTELFVYFSTHEEPIEFTH